MRYDVRGIASAAAWLPVLRRFLSLATTGRVPMSLRPPDRRARRLTLLLRAGDALRAGATQREIAERLLSKDAAEPRWRTEAPDLRGRAQRLAIGARHLAAGGWRRLLR